MKNKGIRSAAFAAAALTMFLAGDLQAAASPVTMPDGMIFDPEYYAASNPDVVSVLGTDPAALYQHYQTIGKTEGRRRLPGLFEDMLNYSYSDDYNDYYESHDGFLMAAGQIYSDARWALWRAYDPKSQDMEIYYNLLSTEDGEYHSTATISLLDEEAAYIDNLYDQLIWGSLSEEQVQALTAQWEQAHGIQNPGVDDRNLEAVTASYLEMASNPSKEMMDSQQVTITVPVWHMDSQGRKTPSTAALQINQAIAQDTMEVFQEIFAGPEKFPINSLGGYAYRDGDYSRSMHVLGLAVDINAGDNGMYNSAGQLLSGGAWNPGTDPYSITATGDVAKAFRRHGWKWLPYDHMHFDFVQFY